MHMRETFVAFVLATSVLGSQELPPVRLGLHSGLSLNLHNTAFPTPKPINRPYFEGSTASITGAVGILIHLPVSGNIALGGRLAYGSIGNAIFEATYNGRIEKISPSLPTLEFLPTISIRDLLLSKQLWLWGGIEAGLPINWSYNRDSVSVTIERDASLPSARTRVALAIGAAYDLPLSKQWLLQPEISIRFPLTTVSSSSQFDSWTVPQFRLGINLCYSFGKEDIDSTMPPDEPYVRARIGRIVTIKPNGDTIQVKNITVEDVRYTEYFPLVPYMFFPANSSSPDPFFAAFLGREAGEVGLDTLKNSLDINANLLTIVCQRMKQYPTVTLTLVGTNDARNELRNRLLSLQRAQALRTELIRCGIDSSRLKIDARDLPSKPSAPNDPDGIIENRRVEFVASSAEILEPFQSRIRIERIASPDIVMFIPDVTSSDPIEEWELIVSQAGRTLRTIHSKGSPRPITWSIQPSELSAQQVPVDYTYRVRSVLGKVSESSGSIDVEYLSSTRKAQEQTKDKTIVKFSLILFDFDSDILTPDNRRVVDLKIVPTIKPGSTIKIYGYTDRIGDTDYNRDLSRRRAQAVAHYLRTKRPEAIYETAGFGESIELYDNNQPTGRQLCRTVQVVIETPVQMQ